MNKDQREIKRKLRILRYAEEIGMSPKHAAILELAERVFIDGVKPMPSTEKQVW